MLLCWSPMNTWSAQELREQLTSGRREARRRSARVRAISSASLKSFAR
jgi:hypothetical protein